MRLLLRVSACVVCLFAVTCSCLAQSKDEAKKKAKPDLSGVWVLVSTKSDPEDRGKEKITDYVLTIIHREPEVKMIMRFKQDGRDHQLQTIYYTDGRPELYLAVIGDPQSFTGWRGKKLVREMSFRPRVNGVFAPEGSTTTIEYELSDDRKTLTSTTRTTSLAGSKVKRVFNRSS